MQILSHSDAFVLAVASAPEVPRAGCSSHLTSEMLTLSPCPIAVTLAPVISTASPASGGRQNYQPRFTDKETYLPGPER